MVKKWSKDELDFLKEHAGKIYLKDIATKLGRSISAIQDKSSRLKLNLIHKRIECKCDFCGKIMLRIPSIFVSHLHNYCSKSCYLSATKTSVKGVCFVCGKEITTTPLRMKDNRGKYCSIECYRKNQRMHFVKELDEQEIVKKYLDEKKSGTVLAREYGCNYTRIYEILRKNNIHIKETKDYLKGVKILDKRMSLPIDSIVKEYKSGLSTYDLAKKYQCSQSTIQKRLIENGIKIRQRDEAVDAFKKSDRYLKYIENMKERVKLQMSKPESKEFHRRKALDMYEKGKFKQSNTLPERILREELLKRNYKEGVDFFHQYKFGNKFSIDFAFPKQKVLIEVQGDYWHANLLKNDWLKLHPIQWKNVQKDIAKRKYVGKYDNGTWKLIEIWESDIKKDVKVCVDKIVSSLSK
jgi:very-short-patch-repair endonuclease/Mor family transcriptional regulator